MSKNTLLRITAIEFLAAILISLAAVEAYDCHIVFVGSVIASIAWYIMFGIANGVF